MGGGGGIRGQGKQGWGSGEQGWGSWEQGRSREQRGRGTRADRPGKILRVIDAFSLKRESVPDWNGAKNTLNFGACGGLFV